MKLYQPTYSFAGMDSERRLRELILYIAGKCANDPTFGAVKLNKILFRADMRSFVKRHQPVTGVEYQALQNGPAPRIMLPLKNDMLRAGEIDEVKRVIGQGYRQERITARRDADLSLFSSLDLAEVDSAVDELWGKSGTAASIESHERAWRIARSAEALIPYESAFLGDEGMAAPEDVARANELARRFGWSRG